jgi:hypothetical protein
MRQQDGCDLRLPEKHCTSIGKLHPLQRAGYHNRATKKPAKDSRRETLTLSLPSSLLAKAAANHSGKANLTADEQRTARIMDREQWAIREIENACRA